MKNFIKYTSIALLLATLTTGANAATINLTGTIVKSVSSVVVDSDLIVNGIITSEAVRVVANMEYSLAVSSVNTENEVTISIAAI
jgi:hypothetical protein